MEVKLRKFQRSGILHKRAYFRSDDDGMIPHDGRYSGRIQTNSGRYLGHCLGASECLFSSSISCQARTGIYLAPPPPLPPLPTHLISTTYSDIQRHEALQPANDGDGCWAAPRYVSCQTRIIARSNRGTNRTLPLRQQTTIYLSEPPNIHNTTITTTTPKTSR